jgi:hypothetical protein
VFLLWPYYNLSFRFDPADLIARYVDVAEPTPMAAMHRELALEIKADWVRNGRIVRRLREALQLALVPPAARERGLALLDRQAVLLNGRAGREAVRESLGPVPRARFSA